MSHAAQNLDALHKEYPKQFGRDEFWKQIKRTVNGKPVDEVQIQMIVKQVTKLLDLRNDDWLLDLGCGNGALGSRLFANTGHYSGVDFSSYLLEIANEYFRPDPSVSYIEADLRSTSLFLRKPNQFSKALVYGAVSYLAKPDVETLIGELVSSCDRLQRIMIGNVPDRPKASDFFAKRGISEYKLDDPNSSIGVWWDRCDFEAMADHWNWRCRIFTMPDTFYGGNYRFDALLERQE